MLPRSHSSLCWMTVVWERCSLVVLRLSIPSNYPSHNLDYCTYILQLNTSQIVNHTYPIKQPSPIAVNSPCPEHPQNTGNVDNFFNQFTYKGSVYQEIVFAPPSSPLLFLRLLAFMFALS
ncbi:hypothetical protein L873DRAFT_363761 [Choiromyces venosus 120613-1]|uniref:Uncharacterized protein n=1 Tax=Choiromyces venosus 120613-1 TaxID=1336337 RepID=A0A3N4JWJ2_9PEZI|nr:hypothetical protein L873DRAFT_363761 [Choiromyces venosus 120613-1]